MTAAIAAARHGANVTLIEKMDDVGKKILATGNGRCNMSNINAQEYGYNKNKSFVSSALSQFNVEDTLTFFEALGLMHKVEAEGRVYPYSNQAAAVLDVLKMEIERLYIHVLPGSTVKTIKNRADTFFTYLKDGSILESEKVILACGGMAGPQYGCNGDGYPIAESIGHNIKTPKPALVQVVHNEWYVKKLKGVRVKGSVSLECNEKVIKIQSGEIQFTEDGLSGICIFDISGEVNNSLDLGKSCSIIIDIFSDITDENLIEILKKRREFCYSKPVEDFLIGMVNNRLAPVLLKLSDVDHHKNCSELTNKELYRLKNVLKKWKVPVVATRSWKHAQVTSGGVDIREINPNTLESKLTEGLYFAGELIDVDGLCGGYNLQWAWSSGYLAGKSAAEACF
ncbi:MAG: NAD(P)/FAD-dependent oxidoreductase [Clostridia bacterium]|nr:NAD(P)/FAD-dependent oxidoreductase [Clostridia bacterium]